MELKDIKDRDVFVKVLDKYGDREQMDMLVEECSELIQASCKLRRVLNGNLKVDDALNNFVEEIADVHIVLQQMLIMCERNWGDAFDVFNAKQSESVDNLSKKLRINK